MIRRIFIIINGFDSAFQESDSGQREEVEVGSDFESDEGSDIEVSFLLRFLSFAWSHHNPDQVIK